MRAVWLAAGLAGLGVGASSLAEERQAATPSARTNDAATGRTTDHAVPRRVQASGAAELSQENAAQIAKVLFATSTPVSQNAHAAVSVGAPLPGDVDVRPLPTAVVDLVPEYRGYHYVVANDQVVIVQPSTRKVVEVIRDCGSAPSSCAP